MSLRWTVGVAWSTLGCITSAMRLVTYSTSALEAARVGVLDPYAPAFRIPANI